MEIECDSAAQRRNYDLRILQERPPRYSTLLRARRLAHSSPDVPLAFFEAEVESARMHVESYATVTSGIAFALHEPESVLPRCSVRSPPCGRWPEPAGRTRVEQSDAGEHRLQSSKKFRKI
jgi:hypothetical protein